MAAVLSLLVAAPLHAEPILYTITAEVDGLSSAFQGKIALGTIITGNLIFDDAAALLSTNQFDVLIDDGSGSTGTATTTTWDASNASLAATIGDTTLNTSGAGTTLTITDTPLFGYSDDQWMWTGMRGPAVDLFGVQLDTVSIVMLRLFGNAIQTADLQVPTNVSAWHHPYLSNTRFVMRSQNGQGIGANITGVTRVPEPSTFALLGLGALWFLRRRR